MIYIRTYKQMETAAARFRRFMAELYDPMPTMISSTAAIAPSMPTTRSARRRA